MSSLLNKFTFIIAPKLSQLYSNWNNSVLHSSWHECILFSGCEYGDYMPLYCSTLLPWDCYDEGQYCCSTCKKYLQPQSNRGEFSTSLSFIYPRKAFSQLLNSDHMIKLLFKKSYSADWMNWVLGCEYGDRAEQKVCDRYAREGCFTLVMREKCCHTCGLLS